jgi:DNA-directed RNA polymerase alpha subunit
MPDEFDYSPLPEELRILGKPAQRALISAGYHSLEAIAASSERELLALHGMGPKSIPTIREVLARHGLELRSR